MKILRVDGADGAVSCTVRTQPCQQTKGLNAKRAEEFEDYIPFKETVEFKQNETSQTIKIKLCKKEQKEEDNKKESPEGADAEEEESNDCVFRVLLEDPQPAVVKLSRKNVAFVTITDQDEDAEREAL